MRLVFMGTSPFAVSSLEALVSAGHDIEAVFTQPDRPRGRGQRTQPPPVKETALALGLNILQPAKLKDPSVRSLLEAARPDLITVVAYGKIIPRWLIDLPPHGIVNVHGSVLPRYRGAAPVNWAIIRGETQTGVCTMQIDEGLDTGPVYLCDETQIGGQETAPEVSERLAKIGGRLLVRTLEGIATGDLRPRPQDEAAATLAPRLAKEDGFIRWEEAALAIHNKVRGFAPWPAVLVRFRDRPCRILETRPEAGECKESPPGCIVPDSGRLRVRCGDGGLLEILRLQPESRKAVSGVEFSNGVHLRPDERFGSMSHGLSGQGS